MTFFQKPTRDDLFQRLTHDDLFQEPTRDDLFQKPTRDDLFERLTHDDLFQEPTRYDLFQKPMCDDLFQKQDGHRIAALTILRPMSTAHARVRSADTTHCPMMTSRPGPTVLLSQTIRSVATGN